MSLGVGVPGPGVVSARRSVALFLLKKLNTDVCFISRQDRVISVDPQSMMRYIIMREKLGEPFSLHET